MIYQDSALAKLSEAGTIFSYTHQNIAEFLECSHTAGPLERLSV
jgi:hypothetical protein